MSKWCGLSILFEFSTLGQTLIPSKYRSEVGFKPRKKTQPVAVELEIMQQARITLAKSPPGTTLDLPDISDYDGSPNGGFLIGERNKRQSLETVGG